MTIFERLYASEINCAVSSFYDGGWTVRLGDDANGFMAEASGLAWAEVEPWLAELAVKHYPDSEFTRSRR